MINHADSVDIDYLKRLGEYKGTLDLTVEKL